MYGMPGLPYGVVIGESAQAQLVTDYIFTPDGSQTHLLRDGRNGWRAGVVDDFGTVRAGRWNPLVVHRASVETL